MIPSLLSWTLLRAFMGVGARFPEKFESSQPAPQAICGLLDFGQRLTPAVGNEAHP